MLTTINDISILLNNSTKNYKSLLFLMIVISLLAGISDFYTVQIVRDSISIYTNKAANLNLNYLYINLFLITICQLFKFFSVWANTKFMSFVGIKIALSTFKLYLTVDTNKNKDIKTSEVLDNTSGKVTLATTGIYSFLTLISGSLSTFFLICSLTLIGGVYILLCLFLLIVYFVICNISIKERIRKNSFITKLGPEKILENSNLMWEDKDLIRLYKKEKNCIQDFQKYNIKFRKALADTAFQSLWPRYMLESIIMIGLLFFIILSVKQYFSINTTFSVSGITATALGIQKLIPSCQQVYKSSTNLNSRKEIIKSLANQFIKINKHNYKPKIKLVNFNDKKEILKIKNLNFSNLYGKKIFKDINFNLGRGQVLLIKGDSGTGKTTLLKCLIGSLDYDGEIIYNNGIISDYSKEIAYFKQNAFLGESSIKEVVLRWQNNPKLISDEEIWEIIEGLGLKNKLKEYKNLLNTTIGDKNNNLSGGQKSRVLIANTLLRRSKILILDEPFSGLDNNTHDNIFNFIKTLNYEAVILSSHNPRTENFCDLTINLNHFK